MPIADWTHADFPESTADAEGVRVIEGGPPGGRNVMVHIGVEYAVRDGRPLHLVVVEPSLDWASGETDDLDQERFPLVVFVQGSGWMEQELGACLDQLIDFARRGYVIAIVEHRPSSVAVFPAQVTDTITAGWWLLRHAEDFHIDPGRVAVWGDSSGGHTALMVAVNGDDPAWSDEPDAGPLPVACVVDFYGPTALDLMDDEPTTMAHGSAGSPESLLLGGSPLADVPDLVRRADPRTYVSPGRPVVPVLIAHGSKDRLVPYAQSVLMYDALRHAGHPVEMIKVRGAGHGGSTLWTPELMDLVAGFLARHL